MTATSAPAIGTEAASSCPLCGNEGTLRARGLHDGWLGVPGTWNRNGCRHCGAMWLDPMPKAEDIHRLYEGEYYTHDRAGSVRESRGRIARLVKQAVSPHPARGAASRLRSSKAIRDVYEGSLMWLGGKAPGKLLDVGCGDGSLLVRMRDRGWNVVGVEPDPHAASKAAAQDLEVVCLPLEEVPFPEQSFDAIVMSHVIEHVREPVRTLERCMRLLRPGGVIALVTPNSRSLGRKCFSKDWLGWDVPRHLCIFTPENLASSARQAGLDVDEIRTTSRSCFSMLPSIAVLSRGSERSRSRGWLRIAALIFWMGEHAASRFVPAGEEILMLAKRPS